MHQAAENGANADIHVEHPQDLAAILLMDFESDIGYADHLASLGVDDLLVQKVAHHPQHVFVGVIRNQDLVTQVDPFE